MITKTIQAWLDRYFLDDSFLDPKINQLSDHSLILERDVVIDKLIEAVRSGSHIAVFGDFDVDGLTSTVILTDFLRKMGGRVTTVVASRFRGNGYGLNDQAADDILAIGSITTCVTLDCGSSDHDRILRLQAAGITVLTVDHHLVPDVKLPADAFINPHRKECPSKFKFLCTAGLTFSVIAGIKRKLSLDIDVLSYLDLVACGTVADVMPLESDNRILVRHGFKRLSEAKRPGIKALMDLAKLPAGHNFTGRDLGFRISPQINAPGRLQSPQVIADLLLSRDAEEASTYSAIIEELTAKRRLITEVITEECIREVEANGYHKHDAIILGDPQWSHGIVGIVAARIVDRYGKPTGVIGSEGRGSLRGPPGSRLYDALVHSKAVLNRFGGHQAAAGCSLDWPNLPAFRDTFRQFFSPATYVPLPASPTPEPLPLDLSDNFISVVDDLAKLEPCGQGNPRPVIQITGKVKSCKSVKGGHLKLEVTLPKNKPMGCFAIGRGDLENTLLPGTQVTVTGDLRKNEWRGKVTAEMFVQDIIL